MKKNALKPMPSLTSDQEAEQFVDTANLEEYDLSAFKIMQFEFEPKSAILNMRLPEKLLHALKQKAQLNGIPYTRYVRRLLENDVALNAKTVSHS